MRFAKLPWKTIPLRKALKIQNGYAFSSKEFSASEGMQLIRIRDLKNGKCTEARYAGVYEGKYIVKSGDLLIGMDGEFQCYEWAGEDSLLNQRVCKIYDFIPDVYSRFVYYGINRFLREIEDNTTFTTVKHLSSKDIQNIHFPLPPIVEQRRIVTILDDAFERIDSAIANTEKNISNAKELSESYLANVFKNRSGEWKTFSLANLCEVKRGISYGVIKLGAEVPDGIPCLRTSNVRWLTIETASVKCISQELSQSYSRTILQGGEVLVNIRGTLGGVAVAPIEMKGWNVSREIAVVPVDKSMVDSEFLAFYVGSKGSQTWLANVHKGVAYTGINLSDLRNLPIALPDIKVQQGLVHDIRHVMDHSASLLGVQKQRLGFLSDLKQSLLQKAFSGELTADFNPNALEC